MTVHEAAHAIHGKYFFDPLMAIWGVGDAGDRVIIYTSNAKEVRKKGEEIEELAEGVLVEIVEAEGPVVLAG